MRLRTIVDLRINYGDTIAAPAEI